VAQSRFDSPTFIKATQISATVDANVAQGGAKVAAPGE